MKYGTSPSGLLVPDRMSAGRSQVVAAGIRYDRSREFHPDNEASYGRRPEPAYLDELHKIDRDLEITWHPRIEKWQVWVRDPKMGTMESTLYCKGWRLLFTLKESATGEAAPLDNRLFALLYHHDASRFGGAMGFYNEMKRREDAASDRMDKEKFHLSQETARGLWDHFKPMVGYGPSDGNKVGKFG